MSAPAVIAMIGGIALLVAVFGGIEIHGIRIPPLPRSGRVISSLIGIVLIGISVWLSLPSSNISQPGVATDPTTPTVALTLTINPETPTLSTVTETSTLPVPPPQRGNFQDFDENNGTPADEYCTDVWYAQCSIHEEQGERIIKVVTTAGADGEAGDEGGTVRINPATGDLINLSSATRFVVWVLDSQGDNDIELRLCTDLGCYPSEEGDAIWSDTSKSVKDTWTKITWDLARFPDFDMTSIRYIQLYEAHDGTYFFDNVGWE